MKHSTPTAVAVRCSGLNWRKKLAASLLTLAMVVLGTAMFAQGAFVRSNANLWSASEDEHINAMNALYGAGNWSDLRFEDVDVSALLADHSFIYLEGGDQGATAMATFLNDNLPALETWVDNGGHMFMNASPNVGGNIDFGFGGVTLVYPNFTAEAEASDPAHPIFAGGIATSYTGNWFGHSILCPPGMSAIMNRTGSPTDVVLAEMTYGDGFVVFGGTTLPFFGHSQWTPQPDCSQLAFEILAYAADGATVICTPELSITCPEDLTVECGSDISPDVLGLPSVEANDCVGELDVTFMDNQISNDNCPLIIARTWIATDGESTEMCTQTITVQDTEAPVISNFPESFTVECSEGQTIDELLAYLDENVPFPTIEDCSGFDTDVQTSIQTEGLECPVVAICSKTVVAFDECGNESSQTFSITVEDHTAPVFEDFEEEVLVSCLEEVPGAEDLMAYDECSDEEIVVESFESNTGNVVEECVLSTAFAPGDDWALWLPVLAAEGLADSQSFVPTAEGLNLEFYNDGTAHIFGEVENTNNPAQRFEVSVWLENERDWAEWSALGRSYKDSQGFAAAGGDLWETWSYHELVNGFSTLTGAGDYAGNVLYLYHMPASYYFGFQCGEAANDKNANFGMSGWFTYDGFVGGESVEGHGDFNVDKECEPGDSGECIHFDEFTYLYRAEDACGNTALVSQTVTVDDEIAPEFVNFPEDITVDCDNVDSVVLPEVEATDNCEGIVLVEYLGEEIVDGDCPHNYQIVYAWAAFDICGNRADAVWTVNVQDTEAPVFVNTPEPQITVECDMVPEPADVMAEDNCSAQENIVLEFYEEIHEGNCPGFYTIIREWYAMDECENESSFIQTINVEDTTAPVFDEYAVEVEAPCDNIDLPILTASDNCGEVVISFTDTPVSGGCAGRVIRDYLAVDECGNEATAQQIITLIDEVAPVFVETPADVTVECDAIPAVADGLFAEDNCDQEVEIEYLGEEIIAGDCPHNYTIVRTWVAIDHCDNETEYAQNITVQDTTAPEFEFVAEDVTVECDQELPAPSAEAFDNCGEVTITVDPVITDGECANEYVMVRTYTATDECGNSTSATQTLTVVDTTAPEFTSVPADLTIECDVEVPAVNAEASDNCGDATVTYSDEELEGECPNEYSIIRTFTAVDACGNTSTATQNITVVDTTAPTFDPFDISTAVPCEEVDAYTLTASDNCGDATVEIIDEILNSGGCLGTLYRVYEATDECGNTSQVEQFITITDTTAPELVNIPGDETLECSDVALMDNGNYFDQGDVFGEDNCGDEVTIIYSEEVQEDGDDCDQSFIIVRTWVAIDYCENEAMAQQTVTVVDTTSPEFVEFPADETVECSDDLPEVVFPIAEDNCDDVVEIELTTETEEGECEGEYFLYRIFRAFDDCGNEVMGMQTITVVDTTAPEFTMVPADVQIECDEEVPATEAMAMDNCSEAIVSSNDEVLDGECPGELIITRTFTAVDACGNEATAQQIINVVDTTAPVFEAYEIEIEAPCDNVDVNILTAEDNCTFAEVSYIDTPVSGGCAGRIIRDYLAVDDCGNQATAQQIITLIDEVAPVFVETPADLTVECDDIPGVADGLAAEDNCDDDVEIEYLGEEIIAGDCPNNYTIVRTWVAIDHCDNETEYAQNITVQDTTAPEFEFVAENVIVECDQELPAPSAEAFDNCGEVTITVDPVITDGECANEYVMVRTYTATDECGNSATATQTLTVVDTTAPEFTFVPEALTIECDEEVPAVNAEATDNCGDATVTFNDEIIENEGDDNEECSSQGFVGYYAGENWTAELNGGDGSITATESELTIVGNNNDADDVLTQVTIAAEGTGEFSFDWNYETFDVDGPALDPAYYINGVRIDLTNEFDVLQDGVVSFMANAGDIIGFGIDATDGAFGEAILTINDFAFEGNCGGCPQAYTIVRTFTAVDACDNEATAQQIINVVDTTAPEFEAYEIEIEAPCDEIDVTILSATDNCGEVEVSYIDTPVSGGCAGRIIRDYLAVDECGNEATAQQIITLIDEVAPVFVETPADLTVECDDIPGVADGLAAEDNCDDDVEIEYLGEEVIAGDCPNNYTIVRTWVAIDHCDNETEYAQNITVQDTTAPEFEFVAENVIVECDQELPAPSAEAFDNCGEVTITVDPVITDGECANEYVMVRTYTATDECGNSTSATQTLTVVDTTAPEFTSVPADLTIECDVEVPAVNAEATDNCGDATVTYSDEELEGECPNEYSIIRTFTAVDACGNASTATQNITVVDTTAPVFEAYEIEIEAPCDNVDVAVLSATDNCGDVEVSYIDTPVSGGCAGRIIRDYVAIDECGNETTAQQIITLTDDVAPVFVEGPADMTVECDNIPSVEDMDGGQDLEEGEIGPGAFVRSNATLWNENSQVEHINALNALYGEGNWSDLRFEDVDVDDLLADHDFIYLEGGDQGGVPMAAFLATNLPAIENWVDNGGRLLMNASPNGGGNIDFGFGGVTLVYPDFTNDAEASNPAHPIFAGGIATSGYNGDAFGHSIICPPGMSAIMNRAGSPESVLLAEMNYGDGMVVFGGTTLPWFGNPGWTPQPDCSQLAFEILAYTAGGTNAGNGTGGIVVEDNCDDEVEVEYLGEEIIDGDCPNNYTIVRTWLATDHCDNEATYVQNITVEDTTAPEFEFVAEDVTVECDQELPAPDALAFDNCGEVTITVDPVITDGECDNEYVMVRTYTATDECGNSATATQTLTVVDTTAPMLLAIGADATLECSDEVPAPTAEASDNCGDVEVDVLEEIIEGDCPQEYTIVRTYTAIDACGNMSQSLTQTINVIDTTAPELEGTPSEELVLDCEDEVPAPAMVSAFDDCQGEIEVSFEEELIGDLPAEGSSADCAALTPEAYEDGETCAGTEPWSVVLFAFNDEIASYYSTLEANWVEYPDGSATLTGSVFCNDNPQAGWEINAEFENGLPWEEWSTQEFPTSYKDDCGISGDEHLDWMYYIMSAGATLTGWGEYEGSVLNISHAPSNFFYGYQVGVAANNVNDNYGSGGWFTYSGSFDGEEVTGSGDFAFDHDCCPQYSIERTWCAVDCAGNETCFTQLISFADLNNEGGNPVIGIEAEEMVEAAFKGGTDGAKLTAYPNPATNRSTIEFELAKPGMAMVEVFTLNGQVVAQIYNQEADAATKYRLELDASNIPTGVYLYRLTTENEVITNRLVISK